MSIYTISILGVVCGDIVYQFFKTKLTVFSISLGLGALGLARVFHCEHISFEFTLNLILEIMSFLSQKSVTEEPIVAGSEISVGPGVDGFGRVADDTHEGAGGISHEQEWLSLVGAHLNVRIIFGGYLEKEEKTKNLA